MTDNNDKFNPHFLNHRKHKEDTLIVEEEQKGGNLNFGPYVAMYYAHQELLEGLTERGQKLIPGSVNENLAGIIEDQRGFPLEDKKWFIKEFQRYINEYVKASANYIGQPFTEDRFSTKFTLMNLWINYMKENEANPEHTHEGMLSWVIFLNTPDLTEERKNYKGKSFGPGGITFHYGEQANPTWAEHSYGYNPQMGGMWIFPAQLRHQVIPFKTKGTRISVSGNLYFNHPKDVSKTLEEVKLKKEESSFASRIAAEIK
tara:strand:- start:42 stop:818 length:777 start_codon:yes stop_codon:yes gene_type:complete